MTKIRSMVQMKPQGLRFYVCFYSKFQKFSFYVKKKLLLITSNSSLSKTDKKLQIELGRG